MSRIYKICVINQPAENATEVFAIKPYLESFDSFKDEIYIRMPELKSQPLKIYYQDAEGDKITISNALDFGIFQEQKINKVFVVKNVSAVPPKTVQFQEARNAAAASTPSVPASARVLHPNVVCDGCDKEIFGYRYKCLECADFDLCMECEPKLHNHHLMIRITDPNDAEICYKSKLGKRFLRHRRSGSLCSKLVDDEEKKRHHHPHHKRHASSASGVRPPTVGDVLASVLQSFAGTTPSAPNAQEYTNNGSSAQPAAAASAAAATQTTAEKIQPRKQSASVGATPLTTPTGCPYGFNIPTAPGKPNLKHGIDMLQSVAQNFATMMDPFATFMEQSANAYASAASAVSAASASSASAAESAANAANNDSTAASASVPSQTAAEPMEVEADRSPAEKALEKPKEAARVLIVDCSDDEDDEDLRKLVTALNVDRESIDASSMASKKDDPSASIEVEKAGSPSREWTLIDPIEIAEASAASGLSTGAIPKKTTPPPTSNNAANNVDYAELSNLLSSHIQTQNQASVAPVQAEPTTPAEATAAAETEKDAAKSAKTPPPTPKHPDARVNEALQAMIAMGFSNEGGWLSQLLETVDGSISNALDLLQPHK